jgi:hypothetical protein
MFRLSQAIAVAVFLSMPLGAWGHGFLRPQTAVTYYLPAPVLYVPVVAYNPYPICILPPVPVSPAAPRQAIPGGTYAPPTAAPASPGPSTPEPPLAAPPGPAKPSAAPPDRSLGFGESTSFYDAYPVATHQAVGIAGERRTVDFWNLTDRDLILRIDGGPPQVLPHGRSLPLAMGSQFTWQVEGRPTQTTRIDSGESGLQIVIRR